MKKNSGGITGGIVLIGLAVLLLTGYWWPGVMFVSGIALAVPALLRREYSGAALAVVVFGGIPYLAVMAFNTDYIAAGALALAGLLTIIRR